MRQCRRPDTLNYGCQQLYYLSYPEYILLIRTWLFILLLSIEI